MSFSITSKGDWSKTTAYLSKMKEGDFFDVLDKYGAQGARALASATPTDTGETADSWTYEIEQRSGYASIHWINSNVDDQGQPIAVMLQYGHGTGTGGYVQGRDYIMPAIRPIFDQIADAVWKVVTQ